MKPNKVTLFTAVWVLATIVGIAFAEQKPISVLESRIEPASSTNANVTISTAGAGLRNCLTDLVVFSSATYQLRILDGGTTDFFTIQPASTTFNKTWSIYNPFCGDPNTAMTIKTDNAGGYQINYQGVIMRR